MNFGCTEEFWKKQLVTYFKITDISLCKMWVTMKSLSHDS